MIAAMLVLLTLLIAPLVLAQQEDAGVGPAEFDFANRPAFYCGYMTGGPEDTCVEDDDGTIVAPDGTRFTLENNVATFPDGHKVYIVDPFAPDTTDTGFLQYQPASEVCAAPRRFGDYAAPVVPCDRPGAIPVNYWP